MFVKRTQCLFAGRYNSVLGIGRIVDEDEHAVRLFAERYIVGNINGKGGISSAIDAYLLTIYL